MRVTIDYLSSSCPSPRDITIQIVEQPSRVLGGKLTLENTAVKDFPHLLFVAFRKSQSLIDYLETIYFLIGELRQPAVSMYGQ